MYELQIDKENNKCILKVTKGMKIESLKALASFLNNCEFEIEQVDKISADQRELIWCLCTELGNILGNSKEEMREILQMRFCEQRNIQYFSLSSSQKEAASSEVATEFIQYVIEFAAYEGYNITVPEGKSDKKRLRRLTEVVPDIQRYVLLHLLKKTCCICGTNTDLHHEPPLGEDKAYDDGLQTGFLPLCRFHHSERHNMSADDFKNKYHIQEVWLTENLVRELKKIYKGHFKAFKEDK